MISSLPNKVSIARCNSEKFRNVEWCVATSILLLPCAIYPQLLELRLEIDGKMVGVEQELNAVIVPPPKSEANAGLFSSGKKWCA